MADSIAFSLGYRTRRRGPLLTRCETTKFPPVSAWRNFPKFPCPFLLTRTSRSEIVSRDAPPCCVARRRDRTGDHRGRATGSADTQSPGSGLDDRRENRDASGREHRLLENGPRRREREPVFFG